MASAKIHYWATTPRDTRDTAAATGMIEIEQKHALVVAQAIDRHGECEVEAAIADLGAVKPTWAKYPAAVGHGVDIEYASGRQRRVRGYDWE